MKALGQRPGTPDWMLPVATHFFKGLAIEFKKPGKTVTTTQRRYLLALREHGWAISVMADAEVALKLVRLYLECGRDDKKLFELHAVLQSYRVL